MSPIDSKGRFPFLYIRATASVVSSNAFCTFSLLFDGCKFKHIFLPVSAADVSRRLRGGRYGGAGGRAHRPAPPRHGEGAAGRAEQPEGQERPPLPLLVDYMG